MLYRAPLRLRTRFILSSTALITLLMAIVVFFVERRQTDLFRLKGVAGAGGKKRDIVLHPRYTKASADAYSSLANETAHHLLGHLGEIEVQWIDSRGAKQRKSIAKDRSSIGKDREEVEAETAAWIVCSQLGIKVRSEKYMARFLCRYADEAINMGLVLKIAGTIHRMGREKDAFRVGRPKK